MSPIERELWERIARLDGEQHMQVLDFVQRLAQPKGEPVRDIMQHARQLDFPREDLEQMRQFIEEEFERINWDDRNNPPAFPNGQ